MSFSKEFAINYWLGYSFMPPSLRLKLMKEIGFNSLYWTNEYQDTNCHECIEQGLRTSCLNTNFNRYRLLWDNSLDGEGLLNEYIQIIIDASCLDCKYIFMHLDGSEGYVVFNNRFNRLQSIANKFNITFHGENLPQRDNLDFICTNTSMEFCCDVGYYYIRQSIKTVIKYIHLHDNYEKMMCICCCVGVI